MKSTYVLFSFLLMLILANKASAQTNIVSDGTDSLMFYTGGNKSLVITPGGKLRMGLIRNTSASAVLQLNSTTGGLLIPRMTTAQRDLMPAMVEGLLIYNNDSSAFELYNGIGWNDILTTENNSNILSDADINTKIEVEKIPNEDKIRFTTAGTQRMILTETGSFGVGLESPVGLLNVSKEIPSNFIDDDLDGYTDENDGFVVTLTGYIGLGTNSPSQRIHLSDMELPGNFADDDLDGFVDEVDGALVLTGQGYLGIGTTNPTSRLHINGKEILANFIDDDGDGYTDEIDQIVMTGFGRVGIGTDNPITRIHFSATEVPFNTIDDDADGYVDEEDDIVFTNTGNIGLGLLNPTERIQLNGLEIAGNFLDDDFDGFTDEIDAIVLTNAGSIGVGTTSPTGRFLVKGIEIEGNFFDDDGDGMTDETDLLFFSNTGNVGFGTVSPLARLHASGTEKPGNFVDDDVDGFTDEIDAFVLTNTGSIGVGNTSPTGRMMVTGVEVEGNFSDEDGDGYTDEIDVLSVTNTGNVGIGVNAPTGRFHVSGIEKPANFIDDDSDGITDETDGFVFSNTGNIGVGTASPLAKFHVNASDFNITDEEITRFSLETDPSSYFTIENATATNGLFVPKLHSFQSGSDQPALTFETNVDNDVNTEPMIFLRSTAFGVSVTVRPLFAINNENIRALTLLANGNLGVGISAPEALIHAHNSAGAQLKIGNSNQPVLEYYFDVDATANLSLMNEAGGAPEMVFNINNTTYNMGVGSVATASSKFYIKGAGTTSGTSGIEVINNSSNGLFFVRDDGTSGFGFASSDAGTAPTLTIKGNTATSAGWGLNVTDNTFLPLFTVRNDGNVGVVIDAPETKFQIGGNAELRVGSTTATAAQKITMYTPGAGFTQVLEGGGDNNKLAIQATYNAGDAVIIRTMNAVSAQTDRLSFTGGATTTYANFVNSNVGINEATPGSNLVIKGFGSTSATSSLHVLNSSGGNSLFVRDDGNVGIGTSAPTANTRLAIKDGHIQIQQSAAPTIAAGAALGSASVSLTAATDVAGKLGFNPGATATAGAMATITFNKTYAVAPIVILTPANNMAAQGAAVKQVYIGSSTTSGFTVTYFVDPNNAPDLSGAYHYYYYYVIETQ